MNEPSLDLERHRKRGRGCLVAISVIAGMAILVGAVIGIVAWRFASSPEGQKALAPSKVLLAAQHAPGTNELRAAGCMSASVYDGNLADGPLELAEVGDAQAMPPPQMRRIVACDVSFLKTPPSCAEVAATYVRAVGGEAPGGFFVTVTRMAQAKCYSEFDERGQPVVKERGKERGGPPAREDP